MDAKICGGNHGQAQTFQMRLNEFSTSFVIYALRDSRTNEVRYVGKTGLKRPQDRLARHLRMSRHGSELHCHRWIRSLVEVGLKPIFQILESGYGTKKDWEACEVKWISVIGATNKLTNHTIGGRGGLDGYMGHVSRMKMSDATKRMWDSPEMRKRLCASMSKRVMSQEAKDHLSKMFKGRIVSLEVRRKMSESQKRRILSPEAREAIRISNHLRTISPETREKHSIHFKAYYSNPEARSKVSARSRARIVSQETKDKMSVAQKSRYAREREILV